ncbi:MAG: general secretion pathway protein GspD [Prochloraceae cyanobacterium]|nr:general secretion pathway protein GspD [Prochloraceae cyanobacterium]
MRKSNQLRKSSLARGVRIVAAATGILLAAQSISFAGVNRKSEINEVEITHKALLLAQAQPDVLVPNPDILINGKPNHTTNPRPQFLPRAIAPPVGDISISNIDTSPSTLNLGTQAVVPRLVLREAPVREVLGLLARAAGLNLVFTSASGSGQQTQTTEQTISLDLENEKVQDVFNSVLLVSGLTANRRGSTIYVGNNLPDSARNLVSRTLRLNQVSASNASAFLASQGAKVERLITPIKEIVDPVTQRVVQRLREPAELRALKITDTDKDSTAPLLLSGLKVSSDDRLNFVTLVGSPRQVEIASSFLVQLDARQRQVAVNVKVVDVNLNNEEFYNSSFSFGVGDSFFSQDQGTGAVRFGGATPPTNDELNSPLGRISDPPAVINPFAEGNTFLDFNGQPFSIPGTGVGTTVIEPDGRVITNSVAGQFVPRIAGVSNNPFVAGVTDFTLATNNVITRTLDPTTGLITTSVSQGTPGTATSGLPSFFQYPNKFLALIQSTITNGNAKILTDPTLVVQEGQEATVKLAQNIVTNFESNVAPDTGVVTTEAQIEEVGLILKINVDRIDDNGFVSLSVAPTVSAPGADFQLNTAGFGAPNTINLITKRELSSGLVRLRDSQTLILSGIIQETDRATVSKVPIFGDLPVIGSLFRRTQRNNERAEVIVLVTPQILDDSDRSSFGYQYTPGRQVRKMLQRRGFPTQGYQ